MKNNLLIFFLLMSNFIIAQYSETFGTNGKGVEGACSSTSPSSCITLNDFTGVNWTVSGPLNTGLTAAADYAKTVGGIFEIRDSDADICWASPTLDISTSGAVSISMPVTWVGLDENEDYIDVKYSLNGGAFTIITNAFGTGSHTVNVTGDNQADGVTVAVSGLSGNTLDIQFCANTSASSELGRLTSVSVPEANVVVLPIELSLFRANKTEKSIELFWTTITEINNEYFSVEKSTNGKIFEQIATVAGAGTIDERQEYSFTDDRPANGTNYYRLRQVDYDGTESLSKVISIDMRDQITISVFPNPAKETIQIANQNEWQANMEVYIYSLNGQLVKQLNYDDADQNVSLDIQDLQKGMYQLQIIDGGQVTTERFVKN